jgi:hypothetical protein
MPNPHTREDELFIAQFSPQLRMAYETALSSGTSRADFAKSIGIKKSSLQDLLDGVSMPGVRTLALSIYRYHLDVSYENTRFRKEESVTPPLAETQLTFPFVLSALDPRMTLKLGPVTENTITLGIQVKRVG